MNQRLEELRRRRKTWPLNFLDEFWDRVSPSPLREMVDIHEMIGSVEYVLAVSKLRDRDIEMIRMRFEKGMTYKEIAEYYSISSARPSRIIRRAMRQICRRPQNRAILSIGVAAYTRCRQTMMEDEKINRLVESRLREARLEDARVLAKQREGNLSRGWKNPFISEYTRIEELPLSIRAYRCMMRADIKTVADIIGFEKRYGLRKIRNLGKKAYQEIIDCLATIGVSLR